MIQRDYSNGGFYDYYTHGGSTRLDKKTLPGKPSGPETKTDTGRAVYGGGGISPDEIVAAKEITPAQRRLLSPMFSFARELVNGRIPGFETYKISRPINFDHDLQPSDFPVSNTLFKAFRDFLTNDPALKPLVPLVDPNRPFIELYLRFNVVTAAYGRVTAERVLINTDDPLVARAVDVLPRARELAQGALGKTVQP